eukprot:1584755-Prymnesium_polylepis.1
MTMCVLDEMMRFSVLGCAMCMVVHGECNNVANPNGYLPSVVHTSTRCTWTKNTIRHSCWSAL